MLTKKSSGAAELTRENTTATTTTAVSSSSNDGNTDGGCNNSGRGSSSNSSSSSDVGVLQVPLELSQRRSAATATASTDIGTGSTGIGTDTNSPVQPVQVLRRKKKKSNHNNTNTNTKICITKKSTIVKLIVVFTITIIGCLYLYGYTILMQSLQQQHQQQEQEHKKKKKKQQPQQQRDLLLKRKQYHGGRDGGGRGGVRGKQQQQQQQEHKKPPLRWYKKLGNNLNLAHPNEKFDATNDDDDDDDDDDNNDNGNGNGNDDGVTVNGNNADTDADDDGRNNSHEQSEHTNMDDTTAFSLPSGQWPVLPLLEENKDDYETMLHPGDGTTIMKVPKFWSPPLHNSHHSFTKEQAQQFGTCATPQTTSQNQPNVEISCPINDRTIFIGVASYRDEECRTTIESIFSTAQYPHRIRIGVVDQIVIGDDVRCNDPIKPCEEDLNQSLCKYKDQIEVYTVEASLSVGPVFARHLGYRLYRGEYYASQSDAHVTYVTNWDTDIIQQFESTKNEMAVLSTYLSDIHDAIDPITGKSLLNTRPIMCNTVYEESPQGTHLRHDEQPEVEPIIIGMPQLQPWWAAGYSFSRGHFVVNVPYDYLAPMIFQGEEMSIGIRGFTVGYDFYAPERSVCFHHYDRKNVKYFDDENGEKYAGTGKKAMKRLLGIVHMNPEINPTIWDHTNEERYGIGNVRTPEQFYGYFGIDVVNKTIEGHLCNFVQEDAKMHKMLSPLLRKDGMGIDYTNFHYHWVDPNPPHKKKKKKH